MCRAPASPRSGAHLLLPGWKPMRRTLLTVLAAGVPLAAALWVPTASAETANTASAPLGCRSLPVKAPAGTKVESVTAVSHAAGTVDVPPVTPLPGAQVPDVPAFCDVTVTLTHPGQ